MEVLYNSTSIPRLHKPYNNSFTLSVREGKSELLQTHIFYKSTNWTQRTQSHSWSIITITNLQSQSFQQIQTECLAHAFLYSIGDKSHPNRLYIIMNLYLSPNDYWLFPTLYSTNTLNNCSRHRHHGHKNTFDQERLYSIVLLLVFLHLVMPKTKIFHSLKTVCCVFLDVGSQFKQRETH